MEHFIKNLSISNFKSIKSLELDTERINLFVGKPNVGKSNILEAVSLLGIVNGLNAGVDFSGFIRFNVLNNLFHEMDKPVIVKTNYTQGNLIFNRGGNNFSFGLFEENTQIRYESMLNSGRASDLFLEDVNFLENKKFSVKGNYDIIEFDKFGSWKSRDKSHFSNIKKYQFKEGVEIDKSNESFSLAVPFGNNLFDIIQSSKKIRRQIASYFKEYGLDLVLDIENRSFEIQRRVDDLVYKTPYRLIADTLQRMIFHVAAIESNRESVLLFEEPENHSFPPYIRDLAERIVESESNQFFITTHSPYLFNTIIEKAKKGDVAIFITTYVDHETKVKRLSEEDVTRLMDYGIDIFFNLNQFVDD